MFLHVLKRSILNAASLLLHFAHGGLVVTGILVATYVAFGISEHGLHGPWFSAGLRSAQQVAAPEQATETSAWNREDEAGAADDSQATPLSPQMHRVVDYLARRYKVSGAGVEPLVSWAEQAGKRVGVDPLLLIAVMAVESSFNPIAESPMGAQGLMQIIPRFHLEKISERGDGASLLDPETNIEVGAQVLKEYLDRTGSMQSALRVYSGSSDAASQYANKVMSEKQRLEAAAHKRAIPVRAAAVTTTQQPARAAPAEEANAASRDISLIALPGSFRAAAAVTGAAQAVASAVD